MVQDAELGVASLAVQVKLTVVLTVEVDTPVDELLDLLGRHRHYLLYGLGVADVVTGYHGVLDMLFEIVFQQIGYRRYSALGEVSVSFVERCLAYHADLTFGVVFVALLFAAIAVAVGGGAALISLFPMADVVLPTSPLSAIVMYIAGILLVGIPLVSLVWAIFSQIFKWQPMNSGLKWTLVILWIVSAACFGICFAVQGATFPELGIFNF